jgi:hypothetical protein
MRPFGWSGVLAGIGIGIGIGIGTVRRQRMSWLIRASSCAPVTQSLAICGSA